jgi:hypothetical protein
MLPIMSTSKMTVVKPSTAWPVTLSYKAVPPIAKLIENVSAPRKVTICNGKAENDVIEVIAYLNKAQKLQELLRDSVFGTSKYISRVG